MECCFCYGIAIFSAMRLRKKEGSNMTPRFWFKYVQIEVNFIFLTEVWEGTYIKGGIFIYLTNIYRFSTMRRFRHTTCVGDFIHIPVDIKTYICIWMHTNTQKYTRTHSEQFEMETCRTIFKKKLSSQNVNFCGFLASNLFHFYKNTPTYIWRLIYKNYTYIDSGITFFSSTTKTTFKVALFDLKNLNVQTRRTVKSM